jgi:uncharacterized membrane protein (DUF4010 family)
MLSVVTLIAASASDRFGSAGVFATAGLAGLADAHAPVASAAALFGSGRISAPELVTCVLLSVSSNSVVRATTAFVVGGRRYGLLVAGGLVLGLAAAWAAAGAFA